MGAVVALNEIDTELHRELQERFQYYGTSIQKGETVYGPMLPGYIINRRTQQIVLPKTAARELIAPEARIEGGPYVACPHLRFTGMLQETPQRDQVTAMAEAEHHLATRGATLLALRTGFGKTVCAGYLATAVLKLRTLVLVCREALLKQWKKELEATTNAVVAVYHGKTLSPFADIVVTTPGMIKHLPYDAWVRGVGTLILDEAVDFCTAGRLPSVLAVLPKYTIACTATPTRPDGLHSILQDLVGQPYVVRKNTQPFNVTQLLTGYKPRIVTNADGEVDWTALQYDLFFSMARNYCLVRLVCDAVQQGHKVLILTAFTGHVDLLMLLFRDAGVDATRFDGGRKSYQNARVLIGSTKKVGTGFDEKSHCDNFDGERIDLMFLVCSTKQFEVLQQYAGRVVGRAEMPAVIHFVDEDRRIKAHWRVADAWYKANLGTVVSRKWSEPVPPAWTERYCVLAGGVLDALLTGRRDETPVNTFLAMLRADLLRVPATDLGIPAAA